jgi:hypothetical protein
MSRWEVVVTSQRPLWGPIYLSGSVTGCAGAHPRLGLMAQPGNGLHHALADVAWWAADNGCYAAGDRFDPGAWLAWLEALTYWPPTTQGWQPPAHWEGTYHLYGLAEPDATDHCLFAALPDVVGDWRATWARSEPHVEAVAALGYRAALVAQDGLTVDTVEWDAISALFIGGTTRWKLSEAAAQLASQARWLGKWVHMGRVNSWRRFRHAIAMGVDSVDGTYIAHAPAQNLPSLLRWLDRAATEVPLPFDQP